MDLEDSVSINEKLIARSNVIEAVNDINWAEKTLSIRINSHDTEFMKEDIKAIMKNTSSRLDLLMFPKVNSAKEVRSFNKLVTNYEKKFNFMGLFITGSEGFIGKHFCSLPEIKKYELIKVDIKNNRGVKCLDIRILYRKYFFF